MTIITVASQKGGVGKTTTATNLASCLAFAGKNTLLFDFDPQGNASSGVGFPKQESSVSRGVPSSDGFLSSILSEKSALSFVQTTAIPKLSLLAASPELSQLELVHRVQERGLSLLRQQLRFVADKYQFVLIDCPPSLGGLPTIALSVSDQVLIPVQCEYYAMEGLSQILPIIRDVQSGENSTLKICGLLLTMFSEELELSIDVVKEVSDYFADLVFKTIIPRDVTLAEAASHGLSAFEYAPLSRGAWSYLELAKEVLRNDRS